MTHDEIRINPELRNPKSERILKNFCASPCLPQRRFLICRIADLQSAERCSQAASGDAPDEPLLQERRSST
jgi:hypothetical protein